MSVRNVELSAGPSSSRMVPQLCAITVLVTLGAVAVALVALYGAAFDEQVQRLEDIARSRRALVEAIARHQVALGASRSQSLATTLAQVEDARRGAGGFGETGELVLARRDGDAIVFAAQRHPGPNRIPSSSDLAEPMRLGLAGQRGHMVGLDYRGEVVLAHYEPMPDLGYAIVAKIDLSEVRAPFIRAGGLAAAVALALLLLGLLSVRFIGGAVVRRLRDTESRYRTLVEHLPAITYLGSLEPPELAYVSPQLEEALGFSPAEWLNDPGAFLRQVHPDDRAVLVAGEPGWSEIRIRHRDGRERWFRHRRGPVPERDDDQLQLGVLVDVTDSRAAAERRDLLSTVVEQSSNLVIITDVDGTIEYVNPAFEQITGYSRTEAIGANPRILNSGEQPPEFYREMWSTLTSGESWTAEFVNRRKDGSLYRQRSTIHPIRDAEGVTHRFVGVGQDVTHERELEAQLRSAQRMEAIGQLSAGIAHDFNNLLTIIMGNENLIRDAVARRCQEVLPELDDIAQAAQRGAKMVKQLLGYSRRATLEFVATDIEAVVEDATAMLRRLVPEHIRVGVRCIGSVPSVAADKGALTQIILNLATNAHGAMPDGGRLSIEIRHLRGVKPPEPPTCEGQVPGEYVRIAVTDTGSGMDAETVDRIFEPFFTTKTPGEGTGLGMAMVYGLTKQHGGFVTVDSEPGKGTTVSIHLPVSDALPAVASVRPAPRGSDPGAETILFVDDDPALVRTGRRVLSRLGYTVLSASSGVEALSTYRDHRGKIDLVISDLIMPEMGGRELLASLRSAGERVPFIFCSGYEWDRGREEGAETLESIPKPWTAVVLAAAVRDALNRASDPSSERG